MTRILDHFLRFAAIVVGYGAAVLAASLFLNLIVVSAFDLTPEEFGIVASGGFVISVPALALLIGYFAFLPAAVAIAVTELAGLRDWLWHALGGGAVAATVLAASSSPSGHDAALADPGFASVVIGAGIAGGIAYWLVAGRGAGGSIRRNREDGSTSPAR